MTKSSNLTLLWLVMIVLTFTTYSMAKLGLSGTYVVMFLILTMLIKSTIIIRDFMELRGVSLLWKGIMYGWLGIVTLGIAIAYLASA